MGSQRGPGQGLRVGGGLRAGQSHSMQARVGAESALGQPGRWSWAQVDALPLGGAASWQRQVGGGEGSSWPQLGILLIPGPLPGVSFLPHACLHTKHRNV